MSSNSFAALRVWKDLIIGLKLNMNASARNTFYIKNLNKLPLQKNYREYSSLCYERSKLWSKKIHFTSLQNIRCLKQSTLAKSQSVLENEPTRPVTETFSKESLDSITYEKFFHDYKTYPNYDR